ncbi:antibiotic biosynthesis monooxygenase family protein [Bradyrhizobium sp.]|uniref:antibiotic biosynthesis monooxygenase family protein n=1 Tax=Bradyrhizobium sp. TaxID=376 RepID=UPI002BB6EDEA|nr:antibiotic biosynthesis monooxygenase family protein [Bradyrhizobium sp.]HMM88496.1 antibiotic biosynthesis monooxygenase [Bradyrhizobium sp.]
MIGLFFEVQTKPGHREQYLDLAASLKPDLEAMGGCLFIDRFRSLTRENLLLSYQIWQDEAALTAWRAHARHHDVQTIGRERVFSDYRIRVAQLIHEAKPGQPVWQPARRTPYNDPARRKPTYMLAAESKHATLPAETEWLGESFASVYRDGHFAHLVDLPDDHAGVEFGPRLFTDPTVQYFRVFEVMRDYAMHERAEAPQYYPPVR